MRFGSEFVDFDHKNVAALVWQGKLRLNDLGAEVAAAEKVLLSMFLNFDRRGSEAWWFRELQNAADARGMCFAHLVAPMDKVRGVLLLALFARVH